MKNGVIHETCLEFYETHGKACETCPDKDRCNPAGFKPSPAGGEDDVDLRLILDFAEGNGYEIRAVGGTAGHFVLM